MNKLYINTWQEILPTLPDNSIDLIIIDPPYIDVVNKSGWDREEQVNEELVSQLFRVAKDTCSIYV
jgi:DNA modification methylase